MKQAAKDRGCKIIPTGIGSDFLEICPTSKPAFVEVKEGCGPLSSTQRATREIVKKLGFDYRVDRCSCDSED